MPPPWDHLCWEFLANIVHHFFRWVGLNLSRLGTELWASTREDLEETQVKDKGVHSQPLGTANLMG